jgi:hypothetical protein
VQPSEPAVLCVQPAAKARMLGRLLQRACSAAAMLRQHSFTDFDHIATAQ